ncbi:ATP-binding protein [Spirillospora sp. CA-294931]|uniref:ATP-binding protein n=1 Tax=Spirillospora sp. CA-294931 TaxID=3240042 RepID=UPI003D8B687D
MGSMVARVRRQNPFIFTLALRAQDAAVVLARDLVAMAFDEWELAEISYDGRIVISELVTNAVRACKPDGDITVRVYLEEGDPVLEVWDESPLLPEFQVAGVDDIRGRGLFIVRSLVKDLVVLRVSGAPGKVVRAVMSR